MQSNGKMGERQSDRCKSEWDGKGIHNNNINNQPCKGLQGIFAVEMYSFTPLKWETFHKKKPKEKNVHTRINNQESMHIHVVNKRCRHHCRRQKWSAYNRRTPKIFKKLYGLSSRHHRHRRRHTNNITRNTFPLLT